MFMVRKFGQWQWNSWEKRGNFLDQCNSIFGMNLKRGQWSVKKCLPFKETCANKTLVWREKKSFSANVLWIRRYDFLSRVMNRTTVNTSARYWQELWVKAESNKKPETSLNRGRRALPVVGAAGVHPGAGTGPGPAAAIDRRSWTNSLSFGTEDAAKDEMKWESEWARHINEFRFGWGMVGLILQCKKKHRLQDTSIVQKKNEHKQNLKWYEGEKKRWILSCSKPLSFMTNSSKENIMV